MFSLHDFKPDHEKLIYSLSNLQNSNKFEDVIKKQPFSRKIELFIPTESSEEGIKHFLHLNQDQKHFYFLPSFKIHQILTQEFIDNFIKKGSLYGLSVNKHPLVDDLCAITPNGSLILSLHKDTFTKLGLPTSKDVQKSFVSNNSSEKSLLPSIVKVDIIKSNKQADFDRTKLCLEKLPTNEFLMAWDNENGEQDNIIFPDGINYKKVLNKIERTNFRKIKLPDLMLEKIYDNNNLDIEYLDQIMDWIGSVHNRIRNYLENRNVDNASEFVTDVMETIDGYGFAETHEGFFTPNYARSQFAKMYSMVNEGHVPWSIMTVWGYTESPYTLKKVSKEAFYSFIFLPNKFYITINST